MRIRLLDVAVMLEDLYEAKSHPEIGWGDANVSIQEYRRILNTFVEIPDNIIEGGLWASNMLNEVGKFKHPDRLKFKTWVKKLFNGTGKKFNFIYNVIEGQ